MSPASLRADILFTFSENLPMKSLFLFLAACSLTLSAQAQQLTPKDITGSWKFIEVEMHGCTVDLVKQKVTFSEQWKSGMSDSDLIQAEKNMLEQTAAYQAMTLEITEKSMLYKVKGKTEMDNGYGLKYEGGKNFLTGEAANDTDTTISLHKGLLHMDIATTDGEVNIKLKRK